MLWSRIARKKRLPASASHLVTGNGFGFAVVAPETATVTRFYAHPYSFVRPDPNDPLSEGIATANFIMQIRWGSGTANHASADYVDDSQVIHMRKRDGDGFCFMPFGFRHATLIISWQPASPKARQSGLSVERSRPILSQKTIRISGIQIHLLKFEGTEESLLLIPLGSATGQAASSPHLLAGNLGWALTSLEKDDGVE